MLIFTLQWIAAPSSSSPRSPARAPRSRAAAIPRTSSFASSPTRTSCLASPTWKPSVCPLCRAGCGLTVRVMEADADVVRNGQAGRGADSLRPRSSKATRTIRSTRAACARAGRRRFRSRITPIGITQPLKRCGARGDGRYEAISWDEAIAELLSTSRQLAAAATSRRWPSCHACRRQPPRRSWSPQFLQASARRRRSPSSSSATTCCAGPMRSASAASSCRRSTSPNARYVISFGADFLGTWNSPVAQSAAYGRMRQGRPAFAGRSCRSSRACRRPARTRIEWVPVNAGHRRRARARPGARDPGDKLRPAAAAGRAGALIDGWSTAACGLHAGAGGEDYRRRGATHRAACARVRRDAPAVAIIGGAPLAQTNGLFNALAVNALNALVGSVGSRAASSSRRRASLRAWRLRSLQASPRLQTWQRLTSRRSSARRRCCWSTAPILCSRRRAPGGCGRRSRRFPFIASFGSFLDETSVLADLILPDHSFLESWTDAVPESGAMVAVASVAAPSCGRCTRRARRLTCCSTWAGSLSEAGHAAVADVRRDAWKRRSRRCRPTATAATHGPRRRRRAAGRVSFRPRRSGTQRLWQPAQQSRCRDRPSRSSTATPGSIHSISCRTASHAFLDGSAGAPALAAGDAGSAHVGDVEQLGGDQSGDGADAWASRKGDLVEITSRRARCVRRPCVARHRAGHRRDAGRPGTPDVHAIRQRPRREPDRAARAAHGTGDGRAGVGGDARADRAGRRMPTAA